MKNLIEKRQTYLLTRKKKRNPYFDLHKFVGFAKTALILYAIWVAVILAFVFFYR